MRPVHYAGTRTALPGVMAPSPIGITERTHKLWPFLPLELPNHSRLAEQVANYPLDGRPVAVPRRRHASGALFAGKQMSGLSRAK